MYLLGLQLFELREGNSLLHSCFQCERGYGPLVLSTTSTVIQEQRIFVSQSVVQIGICEVENVSLYLQDQSVILLGGLKSDLNWTGHIIDRQIDPQMSERKKKSERGYFGSHFYILTLFCLLRERLGLYIWICVFYKNAYMLTRTLLGQNYIFSYFLIVEQYLVCNGHSLNH